MKLISILCSLVLTSCTYSITMAHTSGTATDLIDEAATATPNTTVSVPVSVTPGIPPI